jgi:hypothetical protein
MQNVSDGEKDRDNIKGKENMIRIREMDARPQRYTLLTVFFRVMVETSLYP